MPFNAKQAFTEMSCGDHDAFDLLESFVLWLDKLDDLIDRDKPVAPEVIAGLSTRVLFTFGRNKFFQANQDMFWGVILCATLAYMDSEEWKNRENVLDRIASQVMKSEYMNVAFVVAFLKGGMNHARAMSRKYRQYDYDSTPAPSSVRAAFGLVETSGIGSPP